MALVYPVLAQVLLTLLLGFRLGMLRVRAVRSRRVHLRDVALSGDAYPEDARKLANSVRNQFETPVIFYVLCGVATFVGAAGIAMALLAWAYVATRVVHAGIHITHNRVQHRFIPFAIGLFVLTLMWIVLAFHLATA
jgi:hypothetical protein